MATYTDFYIFGSGYHGDSPHHNTQSINWVGGDDTDKMGGDIHTEPGTELKDTDAVLGTPRVGEEAILEWRDHAITVEICGFTVGPNRYYIRLDAGEGKRSVRGTCGFYPLDGEIREYSGAMGQQVICASSVVLREKPDQSDRPDPVLYDAEKAVNDAKEAYARGEIGELEMENQIERGLEQLRDAGLYPSDAPIEI